MCMAMIMAVGVNNTSFGQDRVLKEIKMDYKYEADGEVNTEKDFVLEAKAGKNYKVTVQFTALEGQESGKVNIGFDRVTDDQIVPNVVKGQNDRSGLLGEPVKEGQTETREFNVAATRDEIILHFSGEGKLLSVKLEEITPEQNPKRCIYTIGDSLVQTYTDKYLPQTGWGQTLQLYFNDNVECRNYAIGGRSTGNFMRQGRLNEVLTLITPGDYVFIEFGHNDASKGNEDRYVSIEDYKKNLAEEYIKPIRQRGGIPVLVTLVNRNDYNAGTGVFNVSFAQYVEAMKQVSTETSTTLIDMNKITVEAFTNINKNYGTGATDTLIYNHAMAGTYLGEYVKGVEDNTHLGIYGARLVAKLMATEIAGLKLEGLSENVNIVEPDKAPAAPINLDKKKYSGFISRIKWDSVEAADFYKIYVANSADGKVTSEFKLAGYAVSCDFAYENAAMKHDYAYKIVAVNSYGESAESEIYIYESDTEKNNSNKNKDKNTLYVTEEKSSGPDVKLVVGGIVFGVAAVVGAIIAIIKKKK